MPVVQPHNLARNSVWRILLLRLLVIVIPLLAVQGAIYLRQYHEQQADELHTNLEMARAVAVAFDGYFQEVRRDELTLARVLSQPGYYSPAEEHALLAETVRAHPGVRTLSWVSATGRVTSSSQQDLVGTSLRGAPWFARVGRDTDWLLTDLARGPAPQAGTFDVVQRVRGERGTASGFLVATMSADSLGPQVGIRRQDGGSYALVDSSGWLVSQSPADDASGKRRDWGARYAVVRSARHGEEAMGTLSFSGAAPRLAAAVRVAPTRWVAMASTPEEETVGPIRWAVLRDATTFFAVAVLALLVAMAATKRITVPVARLRQHALEVGQGHLQHRVEVSGPKELTDLATAFNRMAKEVQSREQEHLRLLELERERARDARLLEAIQEHTLTLLFYLDRELRFRHVNAAYSLATGLRREEVLGRRFPEVNESTELLALFEQVRDTGEAVQQRELFRPATQRPPVGAGFWDISVVPVKDEAGQVEGLVVTAVEVTQQVRAREERLETERLRAHLAETIAAEINHRMKNNLMLLSGMLQLQLAEQPPGSMAAQELRQAIARISSLSAVHEQLHEGKARRVELKETLQRIASIAVSALSRETVEVSVEGESVYVPSRAGSVLAAVANELITNAIKHGAPDADGRLRLRVSVRREAGVVRLHVWNSGAPIAADFDPGHQRGLGLKLVQGLTTEQLGGSFRMLPYGNGTCAEIVLEERVLDSHISAT